MALTSVNKARFPAGSKVFKIDALTFTGVTSGAFKTGLGNVLFASYVSTVDDAFDIYLNFSDAGTTVEGGTVFINNVASGAVGTLIVIGE